jgi:hypothetical protein
MTPKVHKRFLDYREKFTYFGRGGAVVLTADQFAAADAEHEQLVAMGEERDDEEEARLIELEKILFRD